MNNEKTLKAIISILECVDFENQEITDKQLISARDLLDTLLISCMKDRKCEHPEDARKNLTCMGDKEKTEQCMICGEMIKSAI